MAILEAAFANKQGQTPQDVERRRRMAAALIESGAGGRPPASGLELAGRLAMTLTGQYQGAKAEREDAKNRTNANKSLVDALLGSSDSSGFTPSVASPSPSSSSPTIQAGSPSAASPDTAATEAYIRDAATKRGIDPDVAVRVARSEGLGPGVWQSNYVKDGKRETSYGPFQLLVGGGLGDKFQKMYGKSPADPSTVNQQIDFALDEAATGGWSPWYGAAKVGVGARMGLDRARALGMQQQAQVASQAPQEVASAQPMTASDAIASQAPQIPPVQKPYVDPQVSTASRGPIQDNTAIPQQAPQLPPPVNVSAPPSPPQTASITGQPQGGSVSSALLAQAAPQADNRAKIAQLLANPYTEEAGQQLLMQEVKRRQGTQQLLLEQQLKQADPAYQTELEKNRLELENLRSPKISPADQQRIDLEKQKLDFERNGISAADKAKTDLDRERLALDRQKFDAEVQKGQWEKMTDGRLFNNRSGEIRDAPPPLPGSVAPKFDDISGIRKEIQQLPSYKNLAQAAPIYKSMAETAGRNSKASDLNLVYGLGKIMDPNSVVREGEMVMVKNTASLPDWLQGAIASLNGGAALTPETRQAIMTEAFGRVNNYNDEFQRNIEQYKGIAQRNSMNQEDIIPPIDKFEPWKSAPAQTENPLPPTPSGGMNKTTTGIPWKVLQ